MKLRGKVVVVTGGARGIGRATVELFAREGAKVAVGDIEDATAAIGAASDAFFQHTDVTDERQFDALIGAAVERWGGLDVLVNNAGIALPGAIADTSVADFDRVMAVNVRSTFLGCKLALPHLRRRGGGSVVNMSSNGGLVGRPGDPVYNASKHAVMGLTKSLALAHAVENIRFNAVCPGPIDTPMLGAPEQRDVSAIVATCPMARVGSPEDVAAAVLFLASDDSRFVTGIGLPVDGGKAAGVMTADRYQTGFASAPG